MPRSTPVIAALAVALAAACAHHQPAPADDEHALLTQRQSELFAALAARDADRAAAFFSHDAVLHVAGMPPIEGRAAIHRFYGNLFRFLSATRATPEAMRLSRGGDMAYTMGRAANEFQGPEGPVEYAGKFLLVWRKPGDEWMVDVYSVSSDQQDASR